MDRVDRMREAWRAERPDLDTSPVEIIARISRLAARFDAAADELMAQRGLTRGTWDIVAGLRRSGAPYERTPSELQRIVVCSSGLMANRLNRLEADGLITRSPNPDDGRGVRVQLTPLGVALVDEILPMHLESQARFVSSLDTQQQATLATALRALQENVDAK